MCIFLNHHEIPNCMKNILKLAYTIAISVIPFFAVAQLEGSIWLFGSNAGLDFRNGKPVAIQGGQINTTEGCATICDAKGNLLMYTDGITVWNSKHEAMPNGTGLNGDPSATQSGVIVPLPGSNKIYYLFTIEAQLEEAGFGYSIIDMTLENGLGDVVTKNIQLKTPVTEKITAVKHRNNKDIWVITHDWDNNAFLAYLLTSNGLKKEPVVSNSGSDHKEDDDNTIGYMKSSPDGSQLAVAVKGEHFFEVFDFDNQSGMVSNPLKFQLEDGSLTYGVEFSPNGSLLYVSAGGTSKVYQVNLQAGSSTAITNSLQVIAENISGWTGALQVGLDGKIYVSPYGSEYIDVIHNPNAVGKACNYEANYLNLDGNSCQIGLPTFIQTYFTKEITGMNSHQKVEIFNDKVVIETGKRFILNNILFDFNKSTLRSESFPELDKVVKILKNNTQYTIEISGHTDIIGNKSYNLNLSSERAKSVATYLESKGIDKKRITSVGFGSTQPIADNGTEEGRQSNRRVEFMLK